MALSPQQRALAELVVQHGHGDRDLAELLGVEEAQARAQAHAVVAELAGRPVSEGTADLVLGRLAGEERAAAERALDADPVERGAAAEALAKLRLVVPGGAVPALPPVDAPSPAPSPTRRLAAPAAAFVLAAGVVGGALALAGGGRDDEALAPPPSAPAPTATAGPAPPGTQQALFLVPARAAPIGASGRVGIGRAGDGAVLRFRALGLRPTRGTERYVVWLGTSRADAVAVTEGLTLGAGEALEGVAPLPPPAAAALPRARFVDVALEPRAPRGADARRRGVTVLRGRLRD